MSSKYGANAVTTCTTWQKPRNRCPGAATYRWSEQHAERTE